MTFKQRYDKESHWRNKATIINLYFLLRRVKRKRTTVRSAASYFAVSVGHISESLFLTRPGNLSITKRSKTRTEALEKLKNRHRPMI